ncbi:MAG: glycosyltransferase [Acidobacteriia bacterium]|nr:glycosyltransferase [Terriglobia bacterium]
MNGSAPRRIKVVALTGGLDEPPARFRVRQHIANLEAAGITVHECVPAVSRHAGLPGLPVGFRLAWVPPVYAAWQGVKIAARLPGIVSSWHGDLTWLERGLVAGWPTLEPLLKRPVVFDVDDAIWLLSPFGRAAAIATARRADMVIAGNSYIADWFRPYARDIRVIPTAVTLPSRPVRERGGEARPFVLGWIGTSWSSGYLSSIEDVLARFLVGHDAELLVVADRPPGLQGLPPDRVRFRLWSPAVEGDFFSQVDVGLMPLVDDDWARGKCALKMLQFMAAGVPVVVSPVGANREVLALGKVGFAAETADGWYEALDALWRDPSLRARLGHDGREVARRHFGLDVIGAQLAAAFRAVVHDNV